MSNPQTCADMIAQTLAANGCKRAWGIPGGEVLAIIDAFERAGIEFLLCKHENAGGFLAEGGWHADGFPPVLVATIGPGVANAVNVVANAHQERVPLIFITGCVSGAEAESYTHQVFDHGKMLAEVTKASFTGTIATCGLMTQKALAIANDPQFGPVHLDIPVTVAEAKAEEISIPQKLDHVSIFPDETAIGIAAEILATAQNPVAIAGVDAVNENASTALTRFCEQHQIPLVTTYKAKGLIDEKNPLCMGAAGLSPKADKLIQPLLEKADAILLVGYDPIEMRAGWRNPWSTEKPVIEITPVNRTHGMHHVSHTIRSSVEPALQRLSAAIPENGRPQGASESNTKELMSAAFAAQSRFGPDRVFDCLRRVLPEPTVATADSGAHRILLSQMWHCRHPRGLLQSSALCTMACAVPLAAGYKHASPDTPVIAFVGDAGLEMGLGELATLREHEIPLIICVLVDESLTLIEMKQRASQRPNLGVDFSGSDFPAVANALGGHGVWIDDQDTLEKEATKALNRETFTVLACRIGRKSYDGLF